MKTSLQRMRLPATLTATAIAVVLLLAGCVGVPAAGERFQNPARLPAAAAAQLGDVKPDPVDLDRAVADERVVVDHDQGIVGAVISVASH